MPNLRRRLIEWVATFLDVVGPTAGTFREDMLSSDPIDPRSWAAYQSRVQRYRILWALYENTSYSHIHPWSKSLKRDYGLYAWARNVYNPAFRIGEFHATHLMGGDLDPRAGDGSEDSSALPILTDNTAIRPGIASLWVASNWQAAKTRWCRWGAVKGDVGLRIVDDEAARKVRLVPEPPEHIRHIDIDQYGNVQGYLLEYLRPDPSWDYNPDSPTQPLVVYAELCERSGDDIRFRTYKAGVPYDWRDYPPDTPADDRNGYDWTRPYGFVPFVLVQHIDHGLGWGWSECHSALSKIRECDDLGSIVTDYGRRVLNSPWLMNTRKPAKPLFRKRSDDQQQSEWDASGDSTEVPRRDAMQLIWNDPTWGAGGKVSDPRQLVGAMPVAEIGAAIDRLLGQLERDFPELTLEGTTSGDSGRARRIPRQAVEAKVHERRAGYDAGLVKAQAMALSIGGMGRYPGYEEIDAGSYARGDLEHRIGNRPVFSIDPMDEYEEEAALVQCLLAAAQANPALVPITMRRLGYAKADITSIQGAIDDAQALAKMAATAKVAGPAGGPKDNPAGAPGPPLGDKGTNAPQPKGETRDGQVVGG